MEGHYQAVLLSVAVLAVLAVIIFIVLRVRRSGYYNPVKSEMRKQRQWIRRGEYNAAMVKGRQNLEMLLNLVAERNGIVLDNTTQAVNNAKNGQTQSYRWENTGHGRKRVKVMTYQQFGWWLDNKGYLDRVARWELNEIRQIGNRAVHENFSDKDEAVNQYDYLEDLLKIMTEKSPMHQKKSEQPQEKEKNEDVKQNGQNNIKESSSKQSNTKQSNDNKQNTGNKQNNSNKQNTGNKQNNSNKQNAGNKQNSGSKQNSGNKQNSGSKQSSSNKQKNGSKNSSGKKSDSAEVTEKPAAVKEQKPENAEAAAAVQTAAKKKKNRKRKPKQQPAEKQPERTDEES